MVCAFRWGPGPWLLGAEIFPMRARAKGMALSTTANWVANFIIAFMTPPLFATIGGGYYFLLLGFCVISGVFVYFVYPETAHSTLEELGSVFNDQSNEEIEKQSGKDGSGAEPPESVRAESDSDRTLRPSVGSEAMAKGSTSTAEKSGQ